MDRPLLTAAASAAVTAEAKPSPATISCTQFINETARYGANVLEPRHGMCLKHLCLIIKTDYSDVGNLSRCMCAPSQCLVCNLINRIA